MNKEIKITNENKNDVDAVAVCPKCGSYNTYLYDEDETEFSYDGTGHYYVDYMCKDCGESFRIYVNFKYEITKAYTR